MIVIVQPCIYPLQFWNIPDRLPAALALGLEDKQAFLRRALSGYAATLYLNTVTNDQDKILGVNTENLRFYLRAELETLPLALENDPVRSLFYMEPGDRLAASIKHLGITHLLVTRAATENPPPWITFLDKTFLQFHAIPVFQDDDVLVYRLL